MQTNTLVPTARNALHALLPLASLPPSMATLCQLGRKLCTHSEVSPHVNPLLSLALVGCSLVRLARAKNSDLLLVRDERWAAEANSAMLYANEAISEFIENTRSLMKEEMDEDAVVMRFVKVAMRGARAAQIDSRVFCRATEALMAVALTRVAMTSTGGDASGPMTSDDLSRN